MPQSFQSDPPTRVGAENKQFSTNGVKSFSRDGSPSNKFDEAAAPLVNSPVDTGASRVEVPEAGRLVSKSNALATIDAVCELLTEEVKAVAQRGHWHALSVHIERLKTLESAACIVAGVLRDHVDSPESSDETAWRERAETLNDVLGDIGALFGQPEDAEADAILDAVRDLSERADRLQRYGTLMDHFVIKGADSALKTAMRDALEHLNAGRETWAADLLRKTLNATTRAAAAEEDTRG